MDLFTEIFGTQLADGTVFTPQEIADKIVKDLPPKVWNKDSKFLDTAVKSGRILIAVKTKLMNSIDLITAYPNEDDREEHIEQNQLYGIAVNEITQLISTRNLYGRLHPDSKIQCAEYDTLFSDISFNVIFTHTLEQCMTGECTVYVPHYLNSQEDNNNG